MSRDSSSITLGILDFLCLLIQHQKTWRNREAIPVAPVDSDWQSRGGKKVGLGF
jgi:hypothetical protein